MSDGIALLRVDETRKQNRVSDEENLQKIRTTLSISDPIYYPYYGSYRSVVANQVPVALLRVHLDGETARVTRRVGGATFATHCRETDGKRRPLAHLGEDGSPAVFGDVMRHLKVAESTYIIIIMIIKKESSSGRRF